MKYLHFFLIILISGLIGWQLRDLHRVHITDMQEDDRGLISVKFTQDGKEYALDYLTKQEYFDLINK